MIRTAGLDWPVPDYPTLCRRWARISVQVPYRASGQPLHLLIDSTGINFRWGGEWQARKHGPSRRRQWRKVHLAIDAGTGEVRRVEFTSSRRGDGPLLPDQLAQIPTEGRSARSPLSVPMIRAAVMAQSSAKVLTLSYRSVAMAATGKKTAPPPPHEMRSCGQPYACAGCSGRSGSAIMSEVGSRPG
jgi:hypothetical protein